MRGSTGEARQSRQHRAAVIRRSATRLVEGSQWDRHCPGFSAAGVFGLFASTLRPSAVWGGWSRAAERSIGEADRALASVYPVARIWNAAAKEPPPNFFAWSGRPDLHSARGRKIRQPIASASGDGGYLEPGRHRKVDWRAYGGYLPGATRGGCGSLPCHGAPLATTRRLWSFSMNRSACGSAGSCGVVTPLQSIYYQWRRTHCRKFRAWYPVINCCFAPTADIRWGKGKVPIADVAAGRLKGNASSSILGIDERLAILSARP